MIGRRDFIALLGAAVAWPLVTRAQQPERTRRIGVLMGVADDREGQTRVAVLKQGLQELGWTDGRNIQIETRFGGADVDLAQPRSGDCYSAPSFRARAAAGRRGFSFEAG